MKKKLILPLLIASASMVTLPTSCDKDKTLTNSPVIISEYIDGTGSNNAIELYNVSDKTVDLSRYTISVFVSSSKQFDVKLSGSLSPKKTYVLVSKGASSDLTNKADLVEQFDFIGKQPVRLYKGKKLVDIIGQDAINTIEFGSNVTLVRKTNYLCSRKVYDEYDWIRYPLDTYEFLGNVENSVTEEELLKGPQLTNEILNSAYAKVKTTGQAVELGNTEYAASTLCGNGGAVKVTLYRGVDGDTSMFNYPQGFVDTMGVEQHNKVRYQCIDTPESYAGNIQEFGIVAKFFTTSKLEAAKDIYVQSVVDGQIVENFGRLLAWVWADGQLINFEVVKRGYSETAFGEVNNMLYKGISYSSYLYNAMLYAKKNKLGKWGEKDPYWDYNTATSTYNGEILRPEDYE